MTRTRRQHSKDGRHAAYTMWAAVPDRNERLRNAHENSPSGEIWRAPRLFGQDVDPDALTKEQWKGVRAARKAWLKATVLAVTNLP